MKQKIQLLFIKIMATGLALFLCLTQSFCVPVSRATTTTTTTAGGANITLSTSSETVKKGDVFTVVCRVTAATGVLEADFYVDFNTSVLSFVEGGTRATKEVGGVHIQSVDNTETPVRRTFSLQFVSQKEGDATIFIRDGAHVMDGEGNPLSVQTNRLEMLVNESGEPEDKPADGEPGATPPAEGATPPANLSGNNKVVSVLTNAEKLMPEFDPEVRTYEGTVPAETETFFIDYVLEDDRAQARVKGNTKLKYGQNKVKLIVTAENGKKRNYVFLITRMSKKPESATPEPASGNAVAPNVPLDKDDHNGYSIVLYVIITLLAIFSIAMVVLVRRQRREIEDLYIEEEEREKQRETENDIRSGEGGFEGSEIRGEDGDFRYRN